MDLVDMKNMFDTLDDDAVLKYGPDNVFSWRGSYDEVCFSIGENVTVCSVKALIEKALTEEFYGYKGGEYRFYPNTPVNFESGNRAWTDGGYTDQWLMKLCDDIPDTDWYDREELLVKCLIENIVGND